MWQTGNTCRDSATLLPRLLDAGTRREECSAMHDSVVQPSNASFVGDRGAALNTPRSGRNIMKMMKWALLGGAALAVTATAARADDLSALKAQIEALQNRVSQLEAQPQAAMPSGYSLMALRDGQGVYDGILPERNGDRVREESGFTISVMPSADV